MERPTFNFVKRMETSVFGNVSRVEIKGKRWYESTCGLIVPSVTTVLDSIPNPGIEKWKARVGPEEAARISGMAKEQGQALHSAVEAYLLNMPNFPEYTPSYVIDLFRKIQPSLNLIDNIQMLEKQLMCNTHAGTPDCIGDFNGKCSIIDFKTAKREPYPDTIKKYFMQCAAYQQLWCAQHPNWASNVMMKYVPTQYVIIVTVEDAPTAQIYTTYSPPVLKTIDKFEYTFDNESVTMWDKALNDFHIKQD